MEGEVEEEEELVVSGSDWGEEEYFPPSERFWMGFSLDPDVFHQVVERLSCPVDMHACWMMMKPLSKFNWSGIISTCILNTGSRE